MVLLGACAAWSLITAAAGGGRPEGVLLAVLAVTAGCAVGRISGALMPVAAPVVGAAAALVPAVLLPDFPFGPGTAIPLGHTGATAALFALATGALCCAAWSAPVAAVRAGLRLAALGVVLTAASAGSVAGCAAGAVVLLCSLAAGSMPQRGVGVVGLAVAVAVTAAGVWAVAAGALPGGLADAVRSRVTAQRAEEWRDALRLAREHWALGVGPGRLGELSGLGARADARPHSAPLQQVAEQGVTGVLLLAAAFGWALHALWRSQRSTPVALTAGATLTALAAIAALGNALSFTVVTAGAGLLVGWATARPLRP
ncbi:O-antigen polymerase [Streptomyces sp. J2-1]|uniref:O-antigen polymerase n=1 Tax=Streptomyces corallincola TaxID=2851888 RepID=UPI001C37FF5C|nr:O-antigen polymerase [Streptomyces corallincola]MBV2352903.1 O-antigen polymerase [Streptomyces corallincola]